MARNKSSHAVENSRLLILGQDRHEAHRRHPITERRNVDELSVAKVSVLGRPEQITELDVPLRSRVGSFTPIRLDNHVDFSGPVDARIAFVPDDVETAAGAEDAMELGDGQGDVEPVERLSRHDRVGGGGLQGKRFGHAGERDDGGRMAVRVARMASIGSTAMIVAPVGTS